MKYIPVIGLEIHAELLTKSKAFCLCENSFGGMPNSRVCPICMGFPGALPNLNKEVVTLAVKAGAALNCKIHEYSAFDRKNYFYPDLPKAYQITQFEYPICTNGFVGTSDKSFRINRIHIEEDAGKLVHDKTQKTTATDYNRCGVALIEIVTEPDFENATQVKKFVEEIALRLKYAGVCDGHLERGSMRVDVNISIMPQNSEKLGTRAEIKNLNSLKSIEKAIEYEINRQSEILEKGEEVLQETRRFDEDEMITKSMRYKENAHDYRYFPEPDIPPVKIEPEEIDKIKNSMPEMPDCRIKRYMTKFKLNFEEARLIVSDKCFSDFYDQTIDCGADELIAARLMLGALNRAFNEYKKNINDSLFTPKQLAKLCKMVDTGRVSKNSANDILLIMFKTGNEPEEIALENKMLMENNEEKLEKIIDEILANDISNVKNYKTGNKKLFGYFMGQVVKIGGKGTNPLLAKEILERKLNNG